MTKMFVFLVFAILMTLNQGLYADSPITSTTFSRGYVDYQAVSSALRADGVLTEELAEYLLRPQAAVDVKMAVINQLSWRLGGKNNTEIFLDYIFSNGYYKDEEDFKRNGTSDELLAMAYLLAMDDYTDVKDAVKYVDLATAHNPSSMTYLVIEGLIKAQNGMWEYWCRIYDIPEEDIDWDMESIAMRIIFGYMNGWKYETSVCD